MLTQTDARPVAVVRSRIDGERAVWTLSILVLAIHVWLYRFEMVNLDGISYLELAWAWRDGRWDEALNAYWSPLYPGILAAALAILNPAPYWEYPTVHLVNAVTACGALGAFVYLVRGFPWGRPSGAGLRIEAVFAYALFLWSAIVLLVAWMESPDMLLAAFIYLAAGALVRMTDGDRRVATSATLGIALGLGYLTKAAMMPLAPAFLAAAWLAARHRPDGLPAAPLRVLVPAVVAFVLLAGPWVAALSAAKGRLTFGDAGRINYVWFVNRSENWPRNWPPHWPHWSGDPENGAPAHPARRINEDPPVYEFATPVGGTYPMWLDPSWWYEGVQPHLDPVDQIRRIKLSLAELYRIVALNPYNDEFFNPQPALLAVLATIVVVSRRVRPRPEFRRCAALWIPSLAAIGLYSLVYVEPRYLGAFITLLWVFAVDALRAPGSPVGSAIRSAGLTVMAAVVGAAILAATWIEAYPAARRLLRGEPDRQHQAWITAERFMTAGLEPGVPVAMAGNAQVATRWAHLLRARIVAEVPAGEAGKLWGDAEAERRAVTAAFRASGARWFVLEQPDGTLPPGWSRVPGTPYAIRSLE